MQRGISGVELGDWRAIAEYSGREPLHYFGLAEFGNWEDFFVLICLLSCLLCNPKGYRRELKYHTLPLPLSVALELNGYFE